MASRGTQGSLATRLLLLNGLAIVCVILFHATGFGFTAMFSWAHRYRPVSSPNYDEAGSIAYYVLRLIEQFVVFSIPAFLFVSGFFVSVLAGRSRSKVSWRAVRARIAGLAVPYLFWSAVVLTGFWLQGRALPASRYLPVLATGMTGPNYYYVPLLIQLYVVAPLIVALTRSRWRALLVATGVLQVAVYVLQYPIVLGLQIPVVTPVALALPKWFFLVHLFWFTFGVVAGFEQQRFRPFLARTRWLWLTSAVVLFVLGTFEWELLLRWSGSPWAENRVTLVDGLYAGSVILSFLAFADVKLPFANSLFELGGKSFGIFLSHGLVMEYFSRGLYHLAPWVLGWQILFLPMVILVGLAGPLLLMALLARSPARRAYSSVFG